MTPHHPIPETLLHAYVDGELDEADLARVEAALAADPALAEEVETWRRDKLLIARVYGPLLDRPLPEPLLRRLIAPAAATPPVRRRWPMALAAAAALVLIGLVGWALLPAGDDPLIVEALALRAGSVRPIEQLPPDGLEASATRDRLIEETLAQPVRAPDLARAGFRLAGLAVYPDRTLLLTYQDKAGRALSLMLRHGTGADRFVMTDRRKLVVCIKENEDLSAVMLGTMSSSEMYRVAALTYTALNL